MFVSGWQNIKKQKNNRLNIKSDIPFSFYEEMNIDPKIFWDYFKIPYTLKSKELYDILKNTKYVLLHNSCSEYKNINHVNNILNTLYISKDDTLVINIEENIYNKEHKFYEIAQKFVYLPIIDYVDTIINAEYIILSDSCFFCLSLHLPIKTKKCYVISRKNWAIPNGKNYDYLHDHKYGFNNKLQKFISLKL